MRVGYYVGVSTAAAAGCLLKAFHQRPNFYSATVYLSQSNACLLILTNLLLVLASSFMYALQRLLYGPLRPIEIEQLSEKAWYAVLDTLLAMPSFREDVGGWLLAMFTLLLAGKVWGWIGEGRVDVLEQQPPANPRLFHARLATSLIVSVLFDLWMLSYCVETVLADPRPGMMVIFTFEFAVLSVFSSFTFARYCLAVIQTRVEKQQMEKAMFDRKNEIRAERAAGRQNDTAGGAPAPASPPNDEPIEVDENELDVPGWEEKRRYLFALEVFTDFVKLMIYIVFFTVSITFNGLPMHIMRDVYMTFASFSKRVADYVAYRKATSDMNTRYPDATTEEIRGDACIVCRETMTAWEQPEAQAQPPPAPQQPAVAPTPTRRRDEGLRAKKLPCGHILHLRCLKAWLERQQVCPTCRRPVVVRSGPTVPGQPGAVAANPAAPNQQAQQPAQRQGRARILNFGPVRIGFLNGPGDQIQNIIRQMQNQPAGAAQPAAQEAIQQGPNHLGLQVPYLNGQQAAPGTVTGAGTGLTAHVPTQIQLMQIEQRLMQDAQALGLEQQQLATLRTMEGEMARLRAMQRLLQQAGVPANQRATVTATANQAPAAVQTMQAPNLQIPGLMPMQPPMTLGQQPFMQLPPLAFRGDAGEQLVNGHESLPQGMVLPDGWSVIPLHQPGGTGPPQISVQPAEPQATSSEASQPPVPIDTAANGTTATAAPPTTSSQQPSGEAAGPRTENGSPLFVPTAAHSTTDSATTAPAAANTVDTQQQAGHTAPWGSDGWSFVEPPNGHTASGEQTKAASSDQADARDESEQQSYDGKGKGKAAEVEDAPDPGA